VKRTERSDRKGVILICVIACLAVSSVLVALAVQSSLRGRREARLQLQLRQTELLCEAGVMRAAKQLENSESYLGEQWRPELNLENYHDAVVDIVVNEQVTEASKQPSKNVTVIAKLDSYLDQDGPMQRTHRFVIPIKTQPTSLEQQ
jgi:type II secretory pathway pseudopilin PulG